MYPLELSKAVRTSLEKTRKQLAVRPAVPVRSGPRTGSPARGGDTPRRVRPDVLPQEGEALYLHHRSSVPGKLREAELKCLRPWVLSCAPSLQGERDSFFLSLFLRLKGSGLEAVASSLPYPTSSSTSSGSLTGRAGEAGPPLHPSRFKNHP